MFRFGDRQGEVDGQPMFLETFDKLFFQWTPVSEQQTTRCLDMLSSFTSVIQIDIFQDL
jgi:hypothetical protein